MTYRRIPFAENEFYHMYNRGTDKRKIFMDVSDHLRFQELLYLANDLDAINIRDAKRVLSKVFEQKREQQLVAIGAYCLMPNHFHILLTPLVEGGAQLFMRKLCTGYSMYFNKRYERTGALFEGRYKSQHAGKDEYLKYLFAYIHLNPIKLIQSDWKEQGIRDVNKALGHARSYSYSSLPDYLGLVRPERSIITPDPFPAYFLTIAAATNNLLEWLEHDNSRALS